jgi:hypothetical protein
MAAQYTEVTLQDMATFLKRAFHALHPKVGTQNGEFVFDLELSDSVVIRVWSSVQRSSDSGAGVGEDAIRVQLLGAKTKRPLVKGKAPIVKRTQGWRTSLQNRIEEAIEQYEEKAAYWDERGNIPSDAPRQPGAGPGPRPPSDAQVAFIQKMMARGSRDRFEGNGIFRNYPKLQWPFNEANVRSLSSMEASRLIDDMKAALGWGRYATEDGPSYSYRR